MMKKNIISVVMLVLALNTIVQTNSQTIDNGKKCIESLKQIKSIPFKVWDVAYVQDKDWTELYSIPNHPAFDSLLTNELNQSILKEINSRRKELNRDTLLSSDYFYVWKPYFDWLRNEDPHYRIMFTITAPNDDLRAEVSTNFKEQGRLPFYSYTINDSIVVSRPFNDKFRAGDLILSINNIPMSEYSRCSYSDRHAPINGYLLNYNFELASKEFDVKVLRDNKEIKVKTAGMTMTELFNQTKLEEYNPTIYEDAKCGYIQIKEFYDNNSRLIKIVTKAINNFKKKGIDNVIIDVRRNPGGSGDKFDELLSIFIDKPSIEYLKGQKLRVSKETLGDYDFLTEDMIGKNISVPDKYIVKTIELNNKKYINGMNYHVLVSESTGSVAASFVNILQYNNAATIVGEPLLHNAIKYGEIIGGNTISYTLLHEMGISTIEFDENTKAVDGVLMPDIHIPYVAKDYLTGEDSMLEKLLEYISSTNAKEVSILTN